MNTAATSVRDLSDAKAKRDLLDSYIAECERIEEWRAWYVNNDLDDCVGPKQFEITPAERIEVFERRRDKLHNDLQNHGIKLHKEASDTLPSIARAKEAVAYELPQV